MNVQGCVRARLTITYLILPCFGVLPEKVRSVLDLSLGIRHFESPEIDEQHCVVLVIQLEVVDVLEDFMELTDRGKKIPEAHTEVEVEFFEEALDCRGWRGCFDR